MCLKNILTSAKISLLDFLVLHIMNNTSRNNTYFLNKCLSFYLVEYMKISISNTVIKVNNYLIIKL